tara:strand:- start:588 stop:920 length:333 start_codon:yes stop_codon:yes gene_type:complete
MNQAINRNAQYINLLSSVKDKLEDEYKRLAIKHTQVDSPAYSGGDYHWIEGKKRGLFKRKISLAGILDAVMLSGESDRAITYRPEVEDIVLGSVGRSNMDLSGFALKEMV